MTLKSQLAHWENEKGGGFAAIGTENGKSTREKT